MLYISQKIAGQITCEAEHAYPNECCGIILGRLDGKKKYAESILLSKNSFDPKEQYHRFRITAEDMLSAEIYARKNGKEIIGFYHSHPDCAAVPSEYDRICALPVYSYIIVSVSNGKAVESFCYELTPSSQYTEFADEEIR